jgi:PAS domain S-box-containing protein
MDPSSLGRGAPWFLDGKATLGIAATLALLIIACVAFPLMLNRLDTIAARVEHTHAVVQAADDLRSALQDAEAAQRGFLLSGELADFDAYRRSVPRAHHAEQTLKSLAADDPAQRERVEALKPVLTQWLAILRNAVEEPDGRVKPAAERPARDDGKPVLDALRSRLSVIRDDELVILSQWSRSAETASRWLGLTATLASLLAVAAAVSAILVINRSAGHRVRAEEALRRREESDRVREQEAMRRSHHQLKQALVESEQARHIADELIRGVLHAAPVALVVLDLDRRVRLWNPAAERVFDWTEAEVLGQPYPLILPDKEAEFHDLMDRIVRGASLVAVQTQRRDRHGKSIDVSVSSAALRAPDGAVNGVLIVLADVTERVALEAEVRRAQKLEAVGRLAGGIAHDFNNLLTVINGCCDLMRLRRGADDPEQQLLESVHGAGERAAALTRQLLAFGGNQLRQPRVLDVNAIVADLVKLLGRLIGADIELQLVLDPAPLLVHADQAQVEQVIMNLALNARDAMPQGGRLGIRTNCVDLDQNASVSHPQLRPGPYAVLTIEDNGTGMDEAAQAHLFEPFFTTKGPGKGTGLGLATVYAAVQQSGGAIEVRTASNEGTTVRVFIPRVEHRPGETASAPAGAAAPSSGEIVLVVEDEPLVRRLVCDILQRLGYTTLQAGDGMAALQVAADYAGPIHLLVTDVVMPRMSGRALADHLCALRPALKVLYLSGYIDDAIVRNGMPPGATFLQKPFMPDALATKVRATLIATAPQ